MQVFYAPSALNGIFSLPFEETIHCLKVLRHKQGDTVLVTNGKGLLIEGLINDENPAGVQIQAVNIITDSKQPQFNMHIAISPLKNVSRLEWFVEKAVELRTFQITPLICHRTEKRKVRTDRLQKIALEAMKQSMFEFLPQINNPVKFEDFVKTELNGFSKYIATCTGNERTNLSGEESKNVVVLIGPEGDFSNEEIQIATKTGFKPLMLGNSRLRTETAGVFVSALMYYKNIKK